MYVNGLLRSIKYQPELAEKMQAIAGVSSA